MKQSKTKQIIQMCRQNNDWEIGEISKEISRQAKFRAKGKTYVSRDVALPDFLNLKCVKTTTSVCAVLSE
jgi:hypothetical protein